MGQKRGPEINWQSYNHLILNKEGKNIHRGGGIFSTNGPGKT